MFKNLNIFIIYCIFILLGCFTDTKDTHQIFPNRRCSQFIHDTRVFQADCATECHESTLDDLQTSTAVLISLIPVCGSDGKTYEDTYALACAYRCGADVYMEKVGACSDEDQNRNS